MPPLTTKRTTRNLKTEITDLIENQTIWKSNNHGVKEETFIQAGRRGEDRQWRWRGNTARQWLVGGIYVYSYTYIRTYMYDPWTWTKEEEWWWGGTGQRGIKGRKKWDNCNSIINKIYLKKQKKHKKSFSLHFYSDL